jgi:hypothetical protein
MVILFLWKNPLTTVPGESPTAGEDVWDQTNAGRIQQANNTIAVKDFIRPPD